MKGHTQEGMTGKTRRIFDHSGIVFGIMVAAVLFYVPIRSCRNKNVEDNHGENGQQIEMRNDEVVHSRPNHFKQQNNGRMIKFFFSSSVSVVLFNINILRKNGY